MFKENVDVAADGELFLGAHGDFSALCGRIIFLRSRE